MTGLTFREIQDYNSSGEAIEMYIGGRMPLKKVVVFEDLNNFVIQGLNGDSAYQVWLDAGNVGSINTFLDSMKGANGKAGAGVAVKGSDTEANIRALTTSPSGDMWIIDDIGSASNGHGLVSDGIGGWKDVGAIKGDAGLTGKTGENAFELWISQGNSGTVTDFMDSLVGATGTAGGVGGTGLTGATGLSAYESWLATGNTGTELEFITKLVGQTGLTGGKGADGQDGADGNDGADGVGLNILPPTATLASRDALSASWNAGDAGKSVLQIDTGEFWSWNGTSWIDAGHIVGVQGIQGLKGDTGGVGLTGNDGNDGKDGNDGADGQGITIKGSDTLSNIQALISPAGDMWIDSATGHGWVSDGLGAGVSHWTDVGSVKGDKGEKGDTGLTGGNGTDGNDGQDGGIGLTGQDGADGNDGSNGADGVGINILPPVADDAEKTALSATWNTADIGKSVLQIDTGEFWSWNGTAWADAGHIVGAQGLKGDTGLTGQDGNDGSDGKDGTGITIKGTDTLSNIQAQSGTAGDVWIESTTGDGWLSDGLGTGVAHWTNIGSIKGDKGDKGDDGGIGLTGQDGQDGTDGSDGVGMNILPPVADLAERNTVSTGWGTADAGKALLQLDTGEFWSWDGSSWTDAGHLTGKQGIQGVKGNDGGVGLTGQDGATGLSAFQVWEALPVNTGKSEADFLTSLIGKDGKDGASIDKVKVKVDASGTPSIERQTVPSWVLDVAKGADHSIRVNFAHHFTNTDYFVKVTGGVNYRSWKSSPVQAVAVDHIDINVDNQLGHEYFFYLEVEA